APGHRANAEKISGRESAFLARSSYQVQSPVFLPTAFCLLPSVSSSPCRRPASVVRPSSYLPATPQSRLQSSITSWQLTRHFEVRFGLPSSDQSRPPSPCRRTPRSQR